MIQFCVAQQQVRGKVTNVSGTALPGATVQIKNQGKEIITDINGDFIFENALLPAEIIVSLSGFQSNQLKIKNEIPVTIVLNNLSVLLNDLKVYAFEMQHLVKDAPFSVSVLGKTQLERYGNTNLIPAVNSITGVKMDERSPGSYRLSIRGNLLRSTFGVRNVKFYWDGIPFTDANGNTYLNQVAFTNVGRMEIIKGPSGSMYGSGTGGVVLISSNAHTQTENDVEIEIAGGSYGMFSASGSYNASQQNNNSSLSFSHLQSDGYRQHTNMRKDVAHYSGKFQLSPKQNINANIFFSDLFYETPGALNPVELIADPRQARPAAGAFAGAVDQQAALYLKTIYAGLSNDYKWNNKWSNITGIYLSHTKFRNPTIRNYERKTEQGVGGRSIMRYNNKSFSGVIGGEYQYSFNNIAVFGNRSGISDTLQYQDEIDSRQYNVFIQGEIKIRKTVLTAGLSYNNYHYGFTRLSSPGSSKNNSSFEPQYIPRISVMQELTEKINLFISASKGYSPPTIDEARSADGLFNNSLEAETGINYEIGIKSDILKNRFSFEAAYYIFSLKNTIVSRRDVSGADYFVNAGKTKQRGLEIGLNYNTLFNPDRIIRQMKIWANYTNIYARFSDYQQGVAKFDGNKLTGTPPNVLVIGIDVNTKRRISGNFSYSYTDAIPLNDANTFFADHYNLIYGKLSIKSKPDKKITAELYLSAEHSFNNPFSLGNDLNAAGNRYYNPSAPTNLTAGVKVNLNTK